MIVLDRSNLLLNSSPYTCTHIPDPWNQPWKALWVSNNSTNSSSSHPFQKPNLAELRFLLPLQLCNSHTLTDLPSLKTSWCEGWIQPRSNRTRKSYWPKCNFTPSFLHPLSPLWNYMSLYPVKDSARGSGIPARGEERQEWAMARPGLMQWSVLAPTFPFWLQTQLQNLWSSRKNCPAVISKGNAISALRLFH